MGVISSFSLTADGFLTVNAILSSGFAPHSAIAEMIFARCLPVSYTHLDVYKRQVLHGVQHPHLSGLPQGYRAGGHRSLLHRRGVHGRDGLPEYLHTIRHGS